MFKIKEAVGNEERKENGKERGGKRRGQKEEGMKGQRRAPICICFKYL